MLFLNIWTDAILFILCATGQEILLAFGGRNGTSCRQQKTMNPFGPSAIVRSISQRRRHHVISRENMSIVSLMLSCNFRWSSHGSQRANGRTGPLVNGTSKLDKSSTTTLWHFLSLIVVNQHNATLDSFGYMDSCRIAAVHYMKVSFLVLSPSPRPPSSSQLLPVRSSQFSSIHNPILSIAPVASTSTLISKRTITRRPCTLIHRFLHRSLNFSLPPDYFRYSSTTCVKYASSTATAAFPFNVATHAGHTLRVALGGDV